MTAEEKKRSDEINAKIDKINKITSLCNFELFSSYSIENINKDIDSVSEDDKLYILWNWGMKDDFSKDKKWSNIVQKYAKDYNILLEMLKNKSTFVKEYVKEQCQTLQDASLELMYLHKDYNNNDLKSSIDITNKILGDKK